MPINNQPTFAAGDIPTATQLNSWMTEIETAFNEGGSSGLETEDFRWPMKAGGHIDMAGNAINGVPRFGTTYNLTNRPSWASAQTVLDEVEARGGAAVLLMGNTTQTSQTHKDGLPSIRPGSYTHVMGHGHSSILGSIYSKAKTNLVFSDMQMSGLNQLVDCEDVMFLRVNFTGTSTYQLYAKNCKRLRFVDCRFDGAATTQLRIEGFEGLTVIGCDFTGNATAHVQLIVDDAMSSDTLLWKYNIIHDSNSAYAFRVYDNTQISIDRLNGASIVLRGNLIADGAIHANGADSIELSANAVLTSDTSTVMSFGANRYVKLFGNVVAAAFNTGIYMGAVSEIMFPLKATVCGNVVISADEAFIWSARYFMAWNPQVLVAMPPVEPSHQNLTVSGNLMSNADAALPVAAIWSLIDDPTLFTFQHIWWGNSFRPLSTGQGLQCFTTNSEATPGGAIGGTSENTKTWFMFTANTSPGTDTTGAVGSDMVDTYVSPAVPDNRTIVQNNNI